MSGARHAALAVHALDGSDRQWLLDRLLPAQRETLRPLLDDLIALGMPPDAGLIGAPAPSATAAVPAASPTSDAAAGGAEPAALLRQASAADLRALMADEPIELVALLLQLDDFPWQRDFLAGLAPHRRTAIESCRAPAPGHTLRDALAAIVARRLKVRAQEVSTSAGQPKARAMARGPTWLAPAIARCERLWK